MIFIIKGDSVKEVYVITGACGGIGKDIAKKMAKKGIVVISDIDTEKLEKLNSEFEKEDIKVESCKCDITSKSDIKELIELVKSLGHFKALINAAGISETANDVKTILEVNLVGTKLLMDSFYKIADSSVIINIASITGRMVPDSFLYNRLLINPLKKNFYKKMKLFIGNDSTAAYAFSKKGVLLLTEKEVKRWADKNSRIISVSPGAIDTELAKKASTKNSAVGVFVNNTPIKRYGLPKEVTGIVDFLVSDDSSFITGTDIVVDGGITSYMKYNDIFGQKKNEIPFVPLSICYILLFLIIPVFFRAYASEEVYREFMRYSIYFIFPMMTVLLSAICARRRIEPFIGMLPLIIFSLSALSIWSYIALPFGLIYGSLAFITNFVKASYDAEVRKNK